VSEDEKAVVDQLQWLHELLGTDKDLILVASHDDQEQERLIANHVLGNKLE
jgi:hypothetical protein